MTKSEIAEHDLTDTEKAAREALLAAITKAAGRVSSSTTPGFHAGELLSLAQAYAAVVR